MPKLKNSEKELLLSVPENAAKLKEVVAIYGVKMSYRDIANFLKVCLNTAKKWVRGLPYTGNVREKMFWTSDVVFRDISGQQYAEAS